VNQIFFEEDVRLILSLPIHPGLDDVVAWHYDSKGLFSVRFAYMVQREHDPRLSRRGGASFSGSSEMDAEHWKGLWKLKCSGKIKHFLWRLTHNSIACRMELRRRYGAGYQMCLM
jgi:hypothetical protein